MRDYGTLANLSAGYFPEKGTFLAITHPFATLLQAYDLHVLGTPPAFVLSQDQTLKIEISAFIQERTLNKNKIW